MLDRLRPLLSGIALCFFLVIALATIPRIENQSTNETVAIEDCMPRPPISGTVTVRVHSGLPNHAGYIILSQQKVMPDTCDFNVITNYRHSFNVDAQGNLIYTETNMWHHNNSEDLWRIEVGVRCGTSFSGIDNYCRQVQVKKYTTAQDFSFDFPYTPPL